MIQKIRNLFNKNFDSNKFKKIYELYLPKKGAFVEVGAFDGVSFSASINLLKQNYIGYYVEPVEENFKNLCSNLSKYNNANLYRYAIGEKNKDIKIYRLGPYSTQNLSTLKLFKTFKFTKKEFKKEKDFEIVSQITFDDFLRKIKIKKNFELLIVDIEGNEENLFKSFNLEYYKPKMIIIELHDNNIDYRKFHKRDNRINNLILDAGYKIVYKDLSDTVYINS